jgi:biotin--protein ligase
MSLYINTKITSSSRRPPSPIPVCTSINDLSGKEHTFNLKILGSEETWHTPCILLANELESGGQAVFSQIHLEVDPFQFEFEESKFTALKDSNATRLEIFSDILSTHLNIEVDSQPKMNDTYSSGFFLGRHEVDRIIF